MMGHETTLAPTPASQSELVPAKDLKQWDLFELPNGSICTATENVGAGGVRQSRIWCAHPPDEISFDPPLVDLPPEQPVRLLRGNEADAHRHHDGYVEAVFRREMDRRHSENMHVVSDAARRERSEDLERERAARPWWKKWRS